MFLHWDFRTRSKGAACLGHFIFTGSGLFPAPCLSLWIPPWAINISIETKAASHNENIPQEVLGKSFSQKTFSPGLTSPVVESQVRGKAKLIQVSTLLKTMSRILVSFRCSRLQLPKFPTLWELWQLKVRLENHYSRRRLSLICDFFH